jgi:hypothetical protein
MLTNDVSHEFHWWTEEVENLPELSCPYNSVKKRRVFLNCNFQHICLIGNG